MDQPSKSLEGQWPLLALLLAALVFLQPVAAADVESGLISFPAKCNCSLTLACTCCQGAVVNPLNMTKTICMTFKLNILKGTVDITLTLDGETLSKFTLDPKTTPTFCLPVVAELTPMAVCIKVNSKLSGLTAMNVCPSFLSTFNSNQILAYDFPCLKLGMSGISMA